jgi:hypothetical protein
MPDATEPVMRQWMEHPARSFAETGAGLVEPRTFDHAREDAEGESATAKRANVVMGEGSREPSESSASSRAATWHSGDTSRSPSEWAARRTGIVGSAG